MHRECIRIINNKDKKLIHRPLIGKLLQSIMGMRIRHKIESPKIKEDP
jgi:hypothetical protein